MREILFRAKNFHDKWLYGYYDGSAEDPALIDENDYGSAFWIKGETLGQYTGLKDKNGVKIFEGDIVIAPLLVPKMTLKLVANMEWNNIWWSFVDKLNNYCEIIGNIHDNPELLEVNNA